MKKSSRAGYASPWFSKWVSWTRVGVFCFGLSALVAGSAARADLSCEDLKSTYDRQPQMEKDHGYYVTRDEAILRGGVGNYVPVIPEKDAKLARSCGRQEAGTAGVDLKDHPQTIFFGLGQSSLKEPDLSKLDSVVDQLKTTNPQVIQIAGYADRLGTPDLNMTLSHERATAVEKYLEEQGIPAKNLQIVALGDQQAQPVSDLTGNPRDRKVVISVG